MMEGVKNLKIDEGFLTCSEVDDCDGLLVQDCPALVGVKGNSTAPSLSEQVAALLGCRAFLWDVLLDGDWCGCARKHLNNLTNRYGARAVGEAFDP
jgi:hypothetical protein